jgi:transcriptional regulator with XRE-family HTH domain
MGPASAQGGILEPIIAQQVRRYRVELSISAADLAARTGLSKGMISRIESATTSCSLTTLQRLAEGLSVPVTRSMTLRRGLCGANPHRHG